MLVNRIFTTPFAETLFSAETELQNMLRFEAMLALSEAKIGLIPMSAAKIIETICLQNDVIWQTEMIQLIENQTLLAGNPAIPFVKGLIQKVKSIDAEAAKYVHFGATSQDVIDTALVLQLKVALTQIEIDLKKLQSVLSELARKHQNTIMMGRTLLQQARPITFGYKVAVWLSGINDLLNQLNYLKNNTLYLQLGGAVGTLAVLGEHGMGVLKSMSIQLDLKNAPITWHTQRNNLVLLATFLGILNTNLGTIGKNISLLMQNEIGEVFEGAVAGKGGSSAMPHKRNPVTSVFMLSIAQRTPALVSTMLSSALHTHERAAGEWHSEWAVLKELVKLSMSNLHHANDLISHLEVDEARMLQNLEWTKGLIFAEDITAALAPKMGKDVAHAFVEKACKRATHQQIHLKEYLLASTDIENYISKEVINQCFNPKNAIGLSSVFVDHVLSEFN
jgi:3-carboxy-cis,cis-muconate cycloisomerase